MADLLITLFMLIILQAVLGFDNLLYISLESKRAPEEKQAKVRKLGIGLAIVLRIVLLVVLMLVVGKTKEVFWTPQFVEMDIKEAVADSHGADTASTAMAGGQHAAAKAEVKQGYLFAGEFNGHALIVLIGGAFIIYTATKEVLHMMHIEHDEHAERKPASAAAVIAMIVVMNVVFSFDSILSAMALTGAEKIMSPEFVIMAIAIVVSGILMIVLAETVAVFLKKNRMYEVLGLFILFVVGIMLLSEGGHLAHMQILGNPIHAMSKGTFYLVIVILVLTDVVQTRYQKKLLVEAKRSGDAHA